MEKKEFKPLDLTNHASQVLRKFFRQEDGDKTNYTATDLYEVLEMSEKKLKEDIKLAVQGLLDELICEVKSIENQGKHMYSDYYSGLRDGYLIAIKIIKKYFPEE